MITISQRHVVACLFIFVVTTSTAQDLQSLVNAEKHFSQTSVDKSVRTAFLENFDHHTTEFIKGEPVNGRQNWEKREDDPKAYLFWWPIYADIAASGDFGYTTGPAVFGGERTNPQPTGGVYYSTVWKKDSNGQWKVLADLGSATYAPSENLKSFSTSAVAPKAVGGNHHELTAILIALDKSYNDDVNGDKVPFDDGYFSKEARVHRPGIAPLTSPESIKAYQAKGAYAFEHISGQLATSNDMAFTYGRVKVTVNRDGKDVVIPLSYMRVWKIEDGEWNIVLDVIG